MLRVRFVRHGKSWPIKYRFGYLNIVNNIISTNRGTYCRLLKAKLFRVEYDVKTCACPYRCGNIRYFNTHPRLPTTTGGDHYSCISSSIIKTPTERVLSRLFSELDANSNNITILYNASAFRVPNAFRTHYYTIYDAVVCTSSNGRSQLCV